MRMHALLGLALAWLLAATMPSAQAQAASPVVRPVLSSEAVFRAARPSVVEVRQFSRLGVGEVSHASGFVVGPQRWIATNYHTVSDAVLEPESVRVVVVTADDRQRQAHVIAVDVINDLALLQTDSPIEAAPLELDTRIPPKGARGFAMGNPGDFGVSIVEGSFNGLFENTDIDTIHFTGAINGGMSGGPAFDTRGQVVGINVATSREDQLVAYLVPAAPLGWLMGWVEAHGAADAEGLREMMSLQIGRLTQMQLENIEVAGPGDGRPDINALGPFQVLGQLHPDITCGVSKDRNPGMYFPTIMQLCRSSDAIYISDEIQVGNVVTAHLLVEDPDMSDRQVARMQEYLLEELKSVHGEELGSFGTWDCQRRRLRAGTNLAAELHACRRPIRDLPGLHDYRFRLASLVRGHAGLVAGLSATGFDRASVMKLVNLWLSAMETRQPPSDTEAQP